MKRFAISRIDDVERETEDEIRVNRQRRLVEYRSRVQEITGRTSDNIQPPTAGNSREQSTQQQQGKAEIVVEGDDVAGAGGSDVARRVETETTAGISREQSIQEQGQAEIVVEGDDVAGAGASDVARRVETETTVSCICNTTCSRRTKSKMGCACKSANQKCTRRCICGVKKQGKIIKPCRNGKISCLVLLVLSFSNIFNNFLFTLWSLVTSQLAPLPTRPTLHWSSRTTSKSSGPPV